MELESVPSRIRREYPAVDVETGLPAGRTRPFRDLAEDTLHEGG